MDRVVLILMIIIMALMVIAIIALSFMVANLHVKIDRLNSAQRAILKELRKLIDK